MPTSAATPGWSSSSLDDPKHPRVTAVVGEPFLKHPRAGPGPVPLRYVCDDEGIKVLDITDLAHPRPVAMLPMADARCIYLARTYAYVAAGQARAGDPRHRATPSSRGSTRSSIAGGCINDLHDVKLGITYVSEFAYLADGSNGLRVVQLTSPETPGNMGSVRGLRPSSSPPSSYRQAADALAISKGLDRDRAVDERGNQIGVFGRIGARPLNAEEQQQALPSRQSDLESQRRSAGFNLPAHSGTRAVIMSPDLAPGEPTVPIDQVPARIRSGDLPEVLDILHQRFCDD